MDNVDPETVYGDFVLIAEGESGPMFAAKHIATGRLVSQWREREREGGCPLHCRDPLNWVDI